MSFCSRFVGDNLVKIPSEKEIEKGVEYEAEKCISYHIVIDVLGESGFDLKSLGIDDCLKGKHKGSMRNYAD